MATDIDIQRTYDQLRMAGKSEEEQLNEINEMLQDEFHTKNNYLKDAQNEFDDLATDDNRIRFILIYGRLIELHASFDKSYIYKRIVKIFEKYYSLYVRNFHIVTNVDGTPMIASKNKIGKGKRKLKGGSYEDIESQLPEYLKNVYDWNKHYINQKILNQQLFKFVNGNTEVIKLKSQIELLAKQKPVISEKMKQEYNNDLVKNNKEITDKFINDYMTKYKLKSIFAARNMLKNDTINKKKLTELLNNNLNILANKNREWLYELNSLNNKYKSLKANLTNQFLEQVNEIQIYDYVNNLNYTYDVDKKMLIQSDTSLLDTIDKALTKVPILGDVLKNGIEITGLDDLIKSGENTIRAATEKDSSYLLNAVNDLSNFADKVKNITSLKGSGLFDLDHKFSKESQNNINKYGNWIVSNITIYRTPVMKILEKFIDIISLNEYSKAKGSDTLFQIGRAHV